jgi:Ca-activated chloride channel family protein
MAKPRRNLVTVIIAVAVIGILAVIFVGQLGDLVRSVKGPLSYDEAVDELSDLMKEVTWREDIVDRVSSVSIEASDLEDSLPAINTFPLVVNPSGGAAAAEIFVSTEKSGSGTDGWMVEAAKAFNGQNQRLQSGKTAKIRIRKIASGTGYQFIASGKYLPQAYSPSNHLWVRMAEARGVTMTPIREKTVGNIAGIVMKSEVFEGLKQATGSLSVADIIDAVVQGNMATGYTNPYASSTGLNFLVTVLATFAGGEESKMLSPEVVSAFEAFQRGIPFVALTTLQMRDSVRRDGSLDAFVMEYQTFIKTEELSSDYEFIPFGLAHDNPLYAVGDLDPDRAEALELFAAFLESGTYRELASDYGFNPPLPHDPPFAIPDGRTLIEAQRIWKQKKDAGRPISAVFLSDVSGSMRGSRLRQLKRALLDGSSFIAPGNSIGLVEFSTDVRLVLPIKPFELLHRSAFHSAVQQMDADGNTAMYDGVAMALTLLVQDKRDNPDVKPMLFVLTDGETNRGLGFGALGPVVEGLQIPVYTIGFEANIEELGRVSAMVEAASLNASEENLRYKIGSLLNSQM